MSKKSEKKSKDAKKPRSPSSGPAGSLPESSRTKLWELFGQIEHEFEQLHLENVACELVHAVRILK